MREATMRSFGMLRISMIVLGFAAAMFITPQCRAQFEIDPDHFDGTDSWQAATLAKVHVRKTNRASAGAGGQALHGNTSGHTTLRSAATRNVSKAQGPEVVAVQNKRKASIRKEYRSIVLDLRDVRLADRDAVKFLRDCEADGMKLENCPAYVREWMDREED